MTSYFLSEDVHLCVHDSQITLLDLSSGKYFGLPIDIAKTLERWIYDWPVSQTDTNIRIEPGILSQLIDTGILTAESGKGKPARPVQWPVATNSLMDQRAQREPRVKPHHVWRFAVSVIYAMLVLRRNSLKRAVKRVIGRKKVNAGKLELIDRQTLLELVTVFDQLRPFAYSRTNTCFLHSLALLEFLAHYGLYADWVFGVRAEPFEAHCWLECHKTAITDTPVNINRLIPIMVV
jgi:hypothetical protein